MPKIQGFCPMGCGETLVVMGGSTDQDPYVQCVAAGCPDRTAVHKLLQDRETEHVVEFTEDGWTVQHPLRERLNGDLFACKIHEALEFDDDFQPNGRYRVTGSRKRDERFETERELWSWSFTRLD